MERIWKERAKFRAEHSLVAPYCHIHWEQTKNPVKKMSPSDPLKIAFLGLPIYTKGWETWKKIIKRFASDPRYEFFHFACRTDSSVPVKFVPVSVSAENRQAMICALRTHDIDVAFLWSVWPETFSFTLHEAMAAGCYVITHPDSGNIQHNLSGTNHGSVLDNEDDALAWFESDRLAGAVREFQNREAGHGSLVFTMGSYRILFETLEAVGS
jgi:hypothetical protein